MYTLFRNEFLKLRTIRSTYLLIAIQQVVVIAGVSGLALNANIFAVNVARRMVAHAGIVSAILTLVLGITAVAGEYRHRTITDTYLTTPRRADVIGAKLVVYTATGVVLGALSAATGLLVTGLWLTGKGGTLDLHDAEIWRTVAGVVGYNAAFAAIGVSLGALVRNLTGAVAIALSWIALFETTVANLVRDVAVWLPNRAGMALDYMPMPLGGPSQWSAAAALLGYAVVFATAAITTTVRRDIT